MALTSCGGGSRPQNVDVSQAARPQQEVSAAIDPRNPKVLLAASNDFTAKGIRTYTSTDGGATWKSSVIVAPPPVRGPSFAVDPWVAIDLRGRELCSFVAAGGQFFVATRDGPHGAWHVGYQGIDPATVGATFGGDDKGSLAVDQWRSSPRRDRAYAAWTRISFLFHPIRHAQSLVISHSDDGGRTWAPPATVAAVSGTGYGEAYPAMGAATNGDVYLTWVAYRQVGTYPRARVLYERVLLARSTDGGAHFGRPVLVSAVRSTPGCPLPTGLRAAPGDPTEGSPDPTVLSVGSRVVVSYVHQRCNGSLDVELAAFDPTLAHRVGGVQVNPPDGNSPSDQFLPAAAYDREAHELWACYYDTHADASRKRVRFTCQASKDGGRTFGAPVAAASVASNENQPGASHGVAQDYGDYEAVVAAHGVAHPFWTDTRDLGARAEEIYAAELTAP